MNDEEEAVILVDEWDQPTGLHAKLSAHRKALRHRAFSVFLFNSAGEILLQQRAQSKYHCGGLWSNACCGHPRAGEADAAAAARRLGEEMGLAPRLHAAGRTAYHAELNDGWYENEIVHLFTGATDAAPVPDPREVGGWRWIAPDALEAEYAARPQLFTPWFGIYLQTIPELVLAARVGDAVAVG
ncbi:isopentenyl-diphosphate Delta-isomerase [Sphingomonas changnyeongensis]|uniref:Isopentenyl-diphosphate Delta-isomerase n=1 Tax=Sphingomonas changnyeongensis TaxID=2698679 RepID=A0A7Z2S8F3_9SPHN|nr:isopentenyl-diphosphate Delta-isomerase [Sphingomonas changnyeongensis]QHL91351.1 isopentenyl-diphosphate Delta-isomerase [Sphingomonas changnyeongensis]